MVDFLSPASAAKALRPGLALGPGSPAFSEPLRLVLPPREEATSRRQAGPPPARLLTVGLRPLYTLTLAFLTLISLGPASLVIGAQIGRWRGGPPTARETTQNAKPALNVADEVRLAQDYESGKGVARDLAQAAYWYRKAADHGDPDAQNQLGYFYYWGTGVERDPQEAARWFMRATGSGSQTAKLNLALLYLRGTGVPRDVPLALQLLRQLAEKGHAQAEAYLGSVYGSGVGVPEDPNEAERWYLRAAKHKGAEGQFLMGTLYSFEPDHQHDYQKAAGFYRRAVRSGFVPAMHSLGVLLVDHPEVPRREPREPLALLQRAAEAGAWRASATLGLLARDGREVQQDRCVALRWYIIAVRQGGDAARKFLRSDLVHSQETLSLDDQQRLATEAELWLLDHPAQNSPEPDGGFAVQFLREEASNPK